MAALVTLRALKSIAVNGEHVDAGATFAVTEDEARFLIRHRRAEAAGAGEAAALVDPRTDGAASTDEDADGAKPATRGKGRS